MTLCAPPQVIRNGQMLAVRERRNRETLSTGSMAAAQLAAQVCMARTLHAHVPWSSRQQHRRSCLARCAPCLTRHMGCGP
jgi:hypothetical protein